MFYHHTRHEASPLKDIKKVLFFYTLHFRIIIRNIVRPQASHIIFGNSRRRFPRFSEFVTTRREEKFRLQKISLLKVDHNNPPGKVRDESTKREKKVDRRTKRKPALSPRGIESGRTNCWSLLFFCFPSSYP